MPCCGDWVLEQLRHQVNQKKYGTEALAFEIRSGDFISFHWVKAVVAVDSSHMTVSSSAS